MTARCTTARGKMPSIASPPVGKERQHVIRVCGRFCAKARSVRGVRHDPKLSWTNGARVDTAHMAQRQRPVAAVSD